METFYENSPELGYIRSFVLGQLSPKDFETLLTENVRLEQILRIEPPIPPFSTSSAYNLYQYLIELNYLKLEHVIDAQGVLTIFIRRRDIKFAGKSELQTWMKHLFEVLPKWLGIDTDYLDLLYQESVDLTAKELKIWLKHEILARFKFVSKPPKWLQSPSWPIDHGVPLVFVGQISAGPYFHDETAVYIFLNPETGEVSTIIQSA